MKTKENIKKERKRNVSILTIFLWLSLIVIMTVITISGIKEKNAIESDEKIKLKIKIEDVEITPEMDEYYKNLTLDVHLNSKRDSKQVAKFNFLEVDSNGVYIYESNKTVENLNKNINSVTKYNVLYIDEFLIEGKYQYLLINGNKNIKYGNNYFSCNLYYNSDIEIVVKYINNIDMNIDIEVEGIEDEEVLNNVYSNTKIVIANYGNAIILNDYLIDGNDTNINIKDVELVSNKISIDILRYQVESYGRKVILEINGKEHIIDFDFYYTIPEEFLIGDEKNTLDIKVKIIYLPNDTYITQNVKWNDDGSGKAVLKLGYTSTGSSYVRPWIDHGIIAYNEPIIYSIKLNNEFELSSEYENNEKWSMIETVNTNDIKYGVPTDIYSEFFYEFDPYSDIEYTGKEYVYVKDTKTIYWLEKDVKMYSGTNEINIVYIGNNIAGNINLDVSTESNLCTVRYFAYGEGVYYQKYNIISPKLKLNHIEDIKVEVNIIVEGEEGKNKHYIGLFEDETSDKTDDIYMLETVDGNGSITIDIKEREKILYIYEVDENGNKILSDAIKYNKNKLEFNSYERKIKVDTDKSVISSVMSGKYDEKKETLIDFAGTYYFETDIGDAIGTDKEDYISNVLNITDAYQDKIVISSETKKYIVEYITEEGGKIEEDVIPGKTPQNVPTPKPDDGYKFVRWEVEENGKRVEVIPGEYEINKDTVFYAVFEKIPVELPADTSDINVGGYVVVLAVAIIGIASVVFFGIRSKKTR